jgi:hypothetical protein
MANNFYGANALTGGAEGALDLIDGALLADGDCALVIEKTANIGYFYTLDASSGAAEASPTIISPNANPGTKRWLLVAVLGGTHWADFIQTLTAAGDLVIKNQAGSTIATFANALTLALANGVAIDEFSTDGTLAGNSDVAVPTEKAVKTYVDANASVPRSNQGSRFTWVDADTITIGAGSYYHVGTVTQQVYWDSAITFDFGSGGSNAGSTDLGATEWHYVYLDDSAIVTQGAALLDADCFLNSTTAPTWSEAKHGWYNGSDRCIFAVYTDGANAVEEFFHNGALVRFADQYTIASNVDIDTTFTDETVIAPGFCTRGLCSVRLFGNATAAYGVIRVNGATGTTGNFIGYTTSDDETGGEFQPLLDSSQIFEFKHSSGGNNKVYLFSTGWFLPNDMR